MGALGGCSRRFAAAVAELSAAAEGADAAVDRRAEAGEGAAVAAAAPAAAGAQLPPLSTPQQHRLAGINILVDRLLGLAVTFLQQEADMTQQQRWFVTELAVLEHIARAVLRLHLALAEEEVPGWVRALAWGVLAQQNKAAELYRSAGRLGQSVQSSFGHLLSGPCLRHAALSLGLAALCAADGGPSYGLPPQLMQRLPVFGHLTGHSVDLRQKLGRQELLPLQLQGMVIAMDAGLARYEAASVHRCPLGSLAVLLRVLAGGPGPLGVGAAQPTRQLVMSSQATVVSGVDALDEAFRILAAQQQRLAEAGAVWQVGARERLALDEEEYWRIGFGLMRHGLRWAAAKDVEALARFIPQLALGELPPIGALPLAMPPGLAGALAGGLLPCLERALRRAGQAPTDGTDSAFIAMLVSFGNQGGLWPLVARALAYGEPQQAAALVATLGKALRTLAVPFLKAGALDTERLCPLAERVAALAKQLLLDAVNWLEAAGVQGGGTAASASAGSPPQQQLRRLLSYAVCEWLPPLCDLVSYCTTLALAGQIDMQSPTYSPSVEGVSSSATVRNRWLPVLARRAERSDIEARAVPGCGAAGDGWRQLLRGSMGVVPALGGSMAAAPRRGEGRRGACGYDRVGPLAEACCCVAAALPREVRAAAVEAVEAGARATAAEGGAGGSGAVGGQSGDARLERGSGRAGPLSRRVAGWSLENARALAAAVQASVDREATAAPATALVAQLQRWVAGGGEEDNADVRGAVRGLWRLPDIDRAARALLSDPADARGLLRTCANPRLRQPVGRQRYCRQQCQAAHWGSGHNQACMARLATGRRAA
ncbi:hypothetical protein TSOC_002163 [Tetrabaena socialis]|uniref:MYND-type domain-containing protein n=1 Tax=Tetrabaena socialis TaxID=47790 RepID=A0A2J8AES2_9CHLO|nr:hypothetical protein TSOC_002163 [Tetrabaena socialis]|eukprot:PNH11018.1 hypothetical protein TSOC_002163 [Tetrabaena socialis]